MEKLLQQIRDNQRFENWCCFPDNAIQYYYDPKTDMLVTRTYLRKGEPLFNIRYIYSEVGDLIQEQHEKIYTDGADNV
jgi:hypothetical protein